ncbi:hypothetical protein Emin_0950 [Elusimicrobium minutum Pei191]|uniref:Uncharacterized protein n=1 Tax=Elusimicrobium minutum (strain Pei191) TaxID=445932 RepID=B2KDA7_ELUMP|nr:DUF1320 family protein [Elusimicrobium minutum]ACC98503.1 hypothetical protein Emin_0950 [Elusimicrobium minutum Pei191]
MAYCTVSDVQAFFQNYQFGADEPVSSVKVNSLMEEWTARIDSVLRMRYVLPITEASDLSLLKQICSKYVAGDIDGIMNDGKSSYMQKPEARNRDLKDEANTLLEELRMGQISLITPRLPITKLTVGGKRHGCKGCL